MKKNSRGDKATKSSKSKGNAYAKKAASGTIQGSTSVITTGIVAYGLGMLMKVATGAFTKSVGSKVA